MSRRIIIVGPSGAGKTSVATKVALQLGVACISMDEFRSRKTHTQKFVLNEGKKVRNYEDPLLWDENAIACKLRVLMQAGQGFVAEGNHLLVYSTLAAIPNVERWYLDVDFKTSVMRRRTRHRGTAPDWSFSIIGERMTREIVEPQKLLTGVRVVDGTLTTDEIVAGIITPAMAASLP